MTIVAAAVIMAAVVGLNGVLLWLAVTPSGPSSRFNARLAGQKPRPKQPGGNPMGVDEGETGSAPGRHEPGLDAIIGRVTADLLARSHLMRPGRVPTELARAARPLGVSEVQVYLADLEQQQLVPLVSEEGRIAEVAAALPIDSTLAGRAYQAVTIQTSLAGAAYQLWIPLVDGTERLGVLGLTVAEVGETMLDRYRTLASLAGMLVGAKDDTSDTYPYVQRTREMALQAELVWAFLPPRTFATGQTTVAASLAAGLRGRRRRLRLRAPR